MTQKATDSWKHMETYPYFAGVFLSGCFFITMSFFFLPTFVISPYKVANLFNFGSILILCSFAVLNGWYKYCIETFLCGDRKYYACGYMFMLLITTYFSIFRRSFFMTLICLLIEGVCLAYFLAAYFPGGIEGIKYLFQFVWSGISKCFMACIR